MKIPVMGAVAGRRRWYGAPMLRGLFAAAAALLALPVASTAATRAPSFVITGHGWGHGVGMSQWGAYGYYLHGWDAPRILAHYYPGTTLGSAKPTIVRVLLVEDGVTVLLGSAAPWSLSDGA